MPVIPVISDIPVIPDIPVMPVMSDKGYFCIMRHGFRRDDPEHEEVKQDISFPPYDCPIINSKTIEILNSLKVFSTVSFDIIYTSPFKRCWQTALLIAKKFMPNTKIIVDYNLREKDSAIIKDSGQKIFPINITQLIPQDKLEKEIDKSELSIEYIQPLDKFIDITNDIYNEPNKIIERNNYIIRLQDSKLNILVITHGDFVGSYYKHLTKKTSYSMKYCGYVLSKNNKFINNENFESTIID